MGGQGRRGATLEFLDRISQVSGPGGIAAAGFRPSRQASKHKLHNNTEKGLLVNEPLLPPPQPLRDAKPLVHDSPSPEV